MKKLKRFLFTAGTTCTLLFIFCVKVSASIITKDEAQAIINTVGKEKATGNILIWFLCAIAFLKISQKIDSYLASLGVNVGHTGGSLLGDAMVVMKTLSTIKSGGNLLGGKSGGSGSGSAAGGGFLSGGLAGAIGRQISNSAAASATGQGSNPIMGKMFDSSLSSGGKFANDVIGKIAKGDINKTGSITGDKAASALTSYLGGKPGDTPAAPQLAETSGGGTGESFSTPSIADSPVNVPGAQGSSGSPEIGSAPFDDSVGGADLAGTEMLGSDIGAMAAMEDGSEESHPHIPQSSDENPIQNADYTTSPASEVGVESSASIPTSSDASTEPSSSESAAGLPGFEPITGSEGDSAAIGTAPFIGQPEGATGSIGTGGIATTEKASSSPAPADSSASAAPPATGSSPVVSSGASTSSVPSSTAGSGSITIGEAPFTTSPAAPAITSGGVTSFGSAADISVGSPSLGSDSGSSVTIGESPYVSSSAASSPVETASTGYDTGSSAASYPASTSPVSVGSTSPISGPDSAGSFDSPHTSGSAGYSAGSGSVQPTYSDVEIGGGRMMGTETTPANPGGIKFGMYDTQQYAEPTGDYSIVKAIDGSKWYKQYAVDTVRKTPYRNDDGKIAYKEELIKTLPQVPKRKDKM